MKHLPYLILMLLVSGWADFASASQPDGPWEAYHENGQLKEKATYKDGQRID